MKILFISHDATRTGAPILLLRLIKALNQTRKFSAVILLFNGGVLEKEFESVGKTLLWRRLKNLPRYKQYPLLMQKKLGWGLPDEIYFNKEIIKEVKSANVIFTNSIGAGGLTMQIPINGKRIITYVHELQVMTETYASQALMNFLKTSSDTVLVPSNAVHNFLVRNYGFPETKLHRLNYVIEPQTIPRPLDYNDLQRFEICLCGTIDWRKGFDLVPLLVKEVAKRLPKSNFHFTWIGVQKGTFEFNIIKLDLEKMGLSGFVSFVEPTSDVNSVMGTKDLFVLLSREDPFPLVVLEAANLAIPTICFDNAGGIPEFVGEDAGIIVDYLAIDEMADAILKMQSDEVFRKNAGRIAKNKLKAMDASTVTQAFWKYIDGN